MAKLVWRVKLVAELGSGVVSETEVARIETFAIGNQHSEQRAQFEELVPISIVPREPQRIQAHDQAGLAETDLRDQRLESVPVSAGGPGFAKIIIDDVKLPWPAEQDCTLNQSILQLSTLLMM